MDALNAVNFWFNAFWTVFIASWTMFLNWISSEMINKGKNPKPNPLVYGPNLAIVGLSLDFTALAMSFSSPFLQEILGLSVTDSSRIWIMLIVIHLLTYSISIIFFNKSNIYNYILIAPKWKLQVYKQVSNFIGVISILTSLLAINNAVRG